MPVTKFHRRSADQRRADFVDATIQCLADVGYRDTTVRRIASAAGVTPGLLRHYYSGKDELVAEAYKTLAHRALSEITRQAVDAGSDPTQQLSAFITASFRKPNLDPALLRIWINFWSLIHTDQEVRKIHADTSGQYRQTLQELIASAANAQNAALNDEDILELATGASALLDGLWVELCLDDRPLSAPQAETIARHFIERASGLRLS